MKIPTWEESDTAVKDGTATPLHIFVFNHEPAGREDEKLFRRQLLALVHHIFTLGALSEFDKED